MKGSAGSSILLLTCSLAVLGCSSNSTIDAGVDPADDAAVGLGFCPTVLDFELIAAEARSDPGYTGGAHGTGLPGGSFYALETYDCDEECRRCKVRGPVRGDRAIVNERCLNDYNQVCSADAECPNAGTDPKARCRFMFPPISFTAFGAFDSCTLAYYEPLESPDPSPIQGVYDLKSGEASLDRNNLILTTALGAPCPSCIGDSSPNDGAKDGTCEFGGNLGQVCDVHGVSNTAIPFLTSWDCLPQNGFGLDTAIPAAGLTTSSIRWGLDANRPNCTGTGFEALTCFCGVCEDSNTACFRDTQCAAPDTCGFAGASGEVVTKPNSCQVLAGNDAGICDWDPDSQTGTCNGTLGPGTSCFPEDDDIIVTGEAQVRNGFFITTFAGLLCLPAFGNALTDSAVGFPGPALLRLPYRVTPKEL